jgi:glycosyltransferase involved in cell wall biosynthesis
VNIAIATDFHSPWVGGPATFIDNFCAYLAGTSHRVTVIAPSPTGPPSVEQRGNLRLVRMPTIRAPVGYQLRVTVRLDAVREALAAAQPDVLQVHHPFPLGYAAIRAARALGISSLAINHTIPACSLYGIRGRRLLYPLAHGAFSTYLVWLLRQVDAVCTPTRTAAGLLRALGYRRPIAVISNGIDTDRFTPAADRCAARRALGLPDRPIILYTGRLDPEKDIRTWLRAAARAVYGREAHLVIGGEGTERANLERLAAELGLADRATFPGYLPAERLPLLYRAADIYCMTSAVELQSISTLEAMASGLPVVAADAGALPELVTAGETGYLAPAGDVDAFAAALRRLLGDPAAAQAMGRAGRARAEAHSLGAVARRHEALLTAVASRNTATLEA